MFENGTVVSRQVQLWHESDVECLKVYAEINYMPNLYKVFDNGKRIEYIVVSGGQHKTLTLVMDSEMSKSEIKKILKFQINATRNLL